MGDLTPAANDDDDDDDDDDDATIVLRVGVTMSTTRVGDEKDDDDEEEEEEEEEKLAAWLCWRALPSPSSRCCCLWAEDDRGCDRGREAERDRGASWYRSMAITLLPLLLLGLPLLLLRLRLLLLLLLLARIELPCECKRAYGGGEAPSVDAPRADDSRGRLENSRGRWSPSLVSSSSVALSRSAASSIACLCWR